MEIKCSNTFSPTCPAPPPHISWPFWAAAPVSSPRGRCTPCCRRPVRDPLQKHRMRKEIQNDIITLLKVCDRALKPHIYPPPSVMRWLFTHKEASLQFWAPETSPWGVPARHARRGMRPLGQRSDCSPTRPTPAPEFLSELSRPRGPSRWESGNCWPAEGGKTLRL